MPFIFAIGFGVGWFLVALIEFLWKHRIIVALLLAAWWVFSTVSDGIDYARHGSLADQTAEISLSFDGTRDVSTRNMGSSDDWFDLTITNNSDRTLNAFKGSCGDYWFRDEKPVPAHSTVQRSYYYVGRNNQFSKCTFSEAEFA